LPEGTEVITPPLTGTSDAPQIIRYAELAKAYAEENGYHYLGQFDNPLHWQIYRDKLTAGLSAIADTIDIYVDNVGTGATFRGFGEALRERYAGTTLYTEAGPLIEHSAFLTGFGYETLTGEDGGSEERNALRQSLGTDLAEIFGEGHYERSIGNIVNAVILLKANPGKAVFTTIGD
jgi:hypothetical protein